MSTHKGTILKFGNGLSIRLPNVENNTFKENDKVIIELRNDDTIVIKKVPTDIFYVVKNNNS